MIGAHKLNEEDVKVIKDLLQLGKTHQSIADMFGVSREHITKINKGERWNDDKKSFVMKEYMENNKGPQGPKRSNDFRDYGSSLPVKKVELVKDNDALDLDQKYYLVKFIESLTNKKIKKMIIEF